MPHVKNLSNEVLTTITAGNINPGESKNVKDWEMPLIHSKKIEITKPIKKKIEITKPIKKKIEITKPVKKKKGKK